MLIEGKIILQGKLSSEFSGLDKNIFFEKLKRSGTGPYLPSL